MFAFFGSGGWETGAWPVNGLSLGGDTMLTMRQPAIATPTGGATADVEARAAISDVLDVLRAHGLIDG